MSENGPRVRKSKGLRPYLPILGLLLIAAMAAVSYVLTPIVFDLLKRSVNLPENSEILIGGAMFVGLVLMVSLVYAAAAPKQDKKITERELAKEREYKQREQLAKRKSKREINLERARQRDRDEGRL